MSVQNLGFKPSSLLDAFSPSLSPKKGGRPRIPLEKSTDSDRCERVRKCRERKFNRQFWDRLLNLGRMFNGTAARQ